MFKIDVQYKVGGREVSADQFADSITRAAIDHAKEQITAKLSNIVCSEHGEHLKVTLVSESLESIQIQIGGCCQALIDKAQKEVS